MKKTFVLAAIFAGVLFAALPAPAAKADVSVSFSFFSNSLTPYGSWVSIGNYGRCWYPAGVPAGWQPYTVGHWGYGPYGWTWVSADPWGDVTYRYGSWMYQPPYGWVWVPGYVWGPAWVTWSYTNDYIGWAPIPPYFSFSVAGYYGSPVVVNRSWYCFVPTRHFASTNIAYARVPVRQNEALLARSQTVTRFPVEGGIVRNTGLDVRNVERRAQTRIQRVSQREIRTAPARIDTAGSRTRNQRIAVAAPASAKPAVRSQERAAPATAPRDVRRVPSSREPSRKSDAWRSEAPAPRREVSRPAERKEVSRPQQRREVSRPTERKQVSRPARPQTEKSRPSASSASSSFNRERSKPPASRMISERVSSSKANTSSARPQKAPQKAKPKSGSQKEKNERGRS